ncbi:MAG: cell division protein FtsZ [Clostridia bacterium]|nr:cell division protein FtsZ [Clostridia bacterium]
MFMFDTSMNFAKIRVVGVGGAGNNAVNRMVESDIISADFYAVNTDKQPLLLSKADNKIQIGAEATKGLGAGSNPELGEIAAEESRRELEEMCEGVNLLFIAAGMGGGTGTGAAPVIAKIAKEKGCLTVAVVTKPFAFEGKKRYENALVGINNLKKYVDTLIIIPNDKLIQTLSADTPMLDALKVADDHLKQGICGIADLIATPALINLDFADVKTIIQNQGLAHMGRGRAKGENRIIEAVRMAVSSPLLETTIEGAHGVIINVTGGRDLTLGQVNEAARLVQTVVDDSANIIFGANIDPNLSEEIDITVIATGFEPENAVENDAANENNPKQAFEILMRANKPQEVVQPEVEAYEARPEQVREEEPVERKGTTNEKELPSFVRKLFGKRN